MKKIILGLSLLAAATLWADAMDPNGQASSATYLTPTPTVLEKWGIGLVPWDSWFKDNTMVTDKTDYVHFFWNAQDFRTNFEVKDKKLRLEEAALELVSRLYPADAKADTVKVDIVYVLERDNYGQPKWDSLQQVAHMEFLKSKVPKPAQLKREPSSSSLQKILNKIEIY